MKYNKKGQEGFSSLGVAVAAIVLIVLGIVVVLFILRVNDRGTQGTEILDPSDLDLMTARCRSAAVANQFNSYCDYIEVNLNDKTRAYVNCLFPQVTASLKKLDLDVDKMGNCNDFKTGAGFCDEMKNAGIASSEKKVTIIEGGKKIICPE